MSVKTLLKEAYTFTKSSTGYDPSKPGSIREVLVNDDAFGMYKNSLSEGLTAEDKAGFNLLAENTRIALLENSTYSLNPYETLALPLLRVFYPKTIAKDLVTVIPMSKPEIIVKPAIPIISAKITQMFTFSTSSHAKTAGFSCSTFTAQYSCPYSSVLSYT